MRQKKRVKLVREKLEAMLSKYERRIQKMAENAYEVRKLLQQLDSQEAKANAVHSSGGESGIGGGNADQNTGALNVPDNNAVEAVLDK